jgi:hypothetical protein
MSELSERAAAELRSIVEQYAGGEALVVCAYFAQAHPMEEHVDVLLRQMGREIQTANWLRTALGMLENLEISVDRHAFAEFLEQIAEETEHYVILADLAEWAAGRKLGPEDLRRYEVYARWIPDAPPEKLSHRELPEATRMVEISHDLVNELGWDHGRELARLSEGGGGGAFIECTRLSGDPFRDRLAAAMQRIFDDEVHHGPERVNGFAETWVRDEADLTTATRWLRRFMAQHLRVRNEIWHNPLSLSELEAIDRGDIVPMAAAAS